MLLVGLLSTNIVALRVELSDDTFSTTGRGKNRNLFITNNSEKMIAIEVYAQSRAMDPNTGVDQLEDVENFLIYPNQLLLQPDQQQVVTLTWVGDEVLDQELAFRVIVEELNLSLGEEGLSDDDMTVRLAALTKVVKAVYVKPENAKANVKISKSEIITDDLGKKKIQLTFDNLGTAHKIMKQTKINIIPLNKDGVLQKDKSKEYIPDELNGIFNILSKSKRVINISMPELGSDVAGVDVSL